MRFCCALSSSAGLGIVTISPAIRKQSRPHLSAQIMRDSASVESARMADKFSMPFLTRHSRSSSAISIIYDSILARNSQKVSNHRRMVQVGRRTPRELEKQLFSRSRSVSRPPNCSESELENEIQLNDVKRWWRCQCSLECMSRYNHPFEALLLGSPFLNITGFVSHTVDDNLASIEAS